MYDVIVIGGGPAGSSAARKASSLGLKTLLRSGQIASEIISGIIKRENSVTMDDYKSLVKDEFEINLKYSLLVSKLAHSIPFFFELAIENESMVDEFMDIALQKITYKGLLKRIIPKLPWYFLRHVLEKKGRRKIQK